MAGGEVRVLGPVELVASDGGAVALAAKQKRLLAALVAAHGRACGVDELVEAVWNGTPPASARSLVQVYVSQLRKALLDGMAVVTRGGAYVLELEPGRLDATRFEQLLAECEAARQDGNAALAASLADRALALWRGRAYGGLAYEEFLRAESERLEERKLAALEARLDAQLALARHVEVLGEALRSRSRTPTTSGRKSWRCSRSTAAAARPRRSATTRRSVFACSRSSDSSQAGSSATCSDGSSSTTPSSPSTPVGRSRLRELRRYRRIRSWVVSASSSSCARCSPGANRGSSR